MADNQRIEDLRRRVQKDPASIAFAQLAEEYRRAGLFREAVDTCRNGLDIHSGYLSARVTLGRALIELGRPDEAQEELETVLASAPENLAALRGLAEIFHTRGTLDEALRYYRLALALARNDPDLERTVSDLAKLVEPPTPAASDGLTFEQMQQEFLQHAPPPVPAATPPAAPVPDVVAAPDEAAAAVEVATPVDVAVPFEAASPVEVVSSVEPDAAPAIDVRMLVALEQFLDAVHVSRAQRHA